MSRIDDIFAGVRGRGGRALMPFACAGHPAPGLMPRLLPALERAGASVVEIGFPFSDPIADGPVIAGAMHEALASGCTAASVFEELGAARGATGLGLVAMVSVSILWRLGAEQTVRRAAEAGLDGFIIPDLPPEEDGDLLSRIAGAGLSASVLVAPTTPEARAAELVARCSGFVYLLARAGVTGAGAGPSAGQAPDIASRVRMLRGLTDLPIACGFGIATAEHVRAVVRHADAAIVGSALVKEMAAAAQAGGDPVEAGAGLVRRLSAGLDEGR